MNSVNTLFEQRPGTGHSERVSSRINTITPVALPPGPHGEGFPDFDDVDSDALSPSPPLENPTIQPKVASRHGTSKGLFV